MKRFAFVILLVIGARVWAQTPEQMLSFAQQLEEDEDAAFALLEYKRFIFQYPQHPQAARARVSVANIQLFYLADLSGARKALGGVVRNHPGTVEAQSAAQLVDFIEVNSDFGGQPLMAFLEAKRAQHQKQFEAAAAKFLEVSAKYPQARLAPEAIVEAGKLQLDSLGKADHALMTFSRIGSSYPRSERLAEAQFLAAQATEKLKGGGGEAISAYGAVAPNDPQNPWRQKAVAEVTRLKRQQNMPKRQFESQFARAFTVVSKGTIQDVYKVAIELGQGLSEREIKATMEEALFAHLSERQQDGHRVQVSAYFSYPVTLAGSADWAPGQPPVFTHREIKTEDKVKGLLFDLLKKK